MMPLNKVPGIGKLAETKYIRSYKGPGDNGHSVPV